jgi:hypothetical protein
MLRRVALVRIDVSEELSSPIIVTLVMEALSSSETSRCVTSQKTAFFIVTAVKA